MHNAKVIKSLYIILTLEAGLGLLLLLTTGAWVSLIIIVTTYGLIVAGAFLSHQLGLWHGGNLPKTGPDVLIETGSTTMPGINLGTGPERTEVISLNLPLEDGVSALQIEVEHGNLRVTGQTDLKEVQLVATKRVFVRDEYTARNELDRLQVRSKREGNLLKIEARPVGGGGANHPLGRGARIDLEVKVPIALAATFSTVAGDLVVRNYQGELTAHNGTGSMIIENYSSGRRLNLSGGAGRITGQQIAAGSISVRSSAGSIELSGVGAENVELEAAAGMIRVRGVNCARYIARAQLGSLDLYDARIERELEMLATAGRVQAENITTNSFRLETTTGPIFYRGTPPLHSSQVKSALGTIELLLLPGGTFNLDARSNVGNVSVGLPITTTYLSSRNNFSGIVGNGGPPLQIQTQVGSIRVAQV